MSGRLVDQIRGVKLAAQVELVVETCVQCGTAFALEADMQAELRRTHNRLYCPSGHGQVYSGINEAEQLRRELELVRNREAAVRARLDQADARVDALAVAKAALERQMKTDARRITNGTCTMCHRHFVNVARHMATKHHPT